MDMSKAALPPRHAPIMDVDRQHPRFNEYMRWRTSLANQLVEAGSFKDWLYQEEMFAESQKIVNHPRHKEWCNWLRNNVNCKPQKHVWLSPWDWEKKFG